MFSSLEHQPATIERAWEQLARDVVVQDADDMFTGHLEDEHYHDVYGTDQDTISSIYPAQDAALLYEENQDCQDGK